MKTTFIKAAPIFMLMLSSVLFSFKAHAGEAKRGVDCEARVISDRQVRAEAKFEVVLPEDPRYSHKGINEVVLGKNKFVVWFTDEGQATVTMCRKWGSIWKNYQEGPCHHKWDYVHVSDKFLGPQNDSVISSAVDSESGNFLQAKCTLKAQK